MFLVMVEDSYTYYRMDIVILICRVEGRGFKSLRTCSNMFIRLINQPFQLNDHYYTQSSNIVNYVIKFRHTILRFEVKLLSAPIKVSFEFILIFHKACRVLTTDCDRFIFLCLFSIWMSVFIYLKFKYKHLCTYNASF